MDQLELDAVLEQVMQTAIAAGREAAGGAASGDAYDRGQVMAYYNVLDVIKEQLDLLGIQLAQQGLNHYDPDELLRLSSPKQKEKAA